MPVFSTFIHDIEAIQPLLEAGADELIVDDSKVSVRCYRDDFSTFGFKRYGDVAVLARRIAPELKLWANIDLLAHHRHFPLIQQALTAAREAAFYGVRVQDPGLLAMVKDVFPEAKVCLATETGNANPCSVEEYAKMSNVMRQCLGNDIPYQAIDSIQQELEKNCELEVLVHGPMLLQFTDRRLMASAKVKQGEWQGSADELATIQGKVAMDRRNKRYPFYDNPHGHLMYHHKDRCLLPYFDLLAPLELESWLFDGRGESLDYVCKAMKAFSAGLNVWEGNSAAFGVDPNWMDTLKSTARRDLAPGFFKQNNTDRFDDEALALRENERLAGRVLDTIKGKCLTFEALEPVTTGEVLHFATPDGKHKYLPLQKMQNAQGDWVDSAEPGELVTVTWVGGVSAQTVVYCAPMPKD